MRYVSLLVLLASATWAVACQGSRCPSAPCTTLRTVAPLRTVQAPADAGAIYAARCAGCHGASGEGGTAPVLIGSGALARHASQSDLAAYIQRAMPPTGPRLGQAEANALAAFAWSANGGN